MGEVLVFRGMLNRIVLSSILALTAGCSKKSDEGSSAQSPTAVAKTAPEPAKQPLTAAFFGRAPATPPGELAKLKPGMPKAEAAKLSPLATKSTSEPTTIEGVLLAVSDSPTGVDLLVSLPADKASLIDEAWGPGQKTDRGGTPVTVWFDAATGVRAALEVSGDSALLRFEPYTPVAHLLGEGKDLPFLQHGCTGKTKEELIALQPALATKSGRLSLPPTEWAFGGDLSLSAFPMSGPIESLAFSIPFQDPEGRGEIMKAIEAKWGTVKEEVTFGGEKALVYNKAEPRIQVSESPGAITIRCGGKQRVTSAAATARQGQARSNRGAGSPRCGSDATGRSARHHRGAAVLRR